jgi:isopentenyldiphosphate isomerase
VGDDELLDVLDEHGRRLGSRPRAAVHRDGDWHAAFHLWVVADAGVLLQRRAATKASWPGFLDATAAGHLLAGEAVSDGLREVEEELGESYTFEALIPLGVHRVDEVAADGARNRELQHVFAVRDDRPLAAWTRFDRVELDGLVLVAHDGFARLATAQPGHVAARAFDGDRVSSVTVERNEMVPAPYLAAVVPQLRAVTAGV